MTMGIDFIITTREVPLASNRQAQAASEHLAMHRPVSKVKDGTQNFNSTKN